MAYTAKKVFEKIFVEDLRNHINAVSNQDAVEVLSNEKKVEVETAQFSNLIRVDAKAFTVIDADGTVNASSKANYNSSTFASNEFDLSRPFCKTLTIGRDIFHVYGIEPGMLSNSYTVTSANAGLMSMAVGKLQTELVAYYNALRNYRLNQVKTFLDEMGASSDQAVLPLGLQLAADSRVGYWNFDNKLTSGLSDAEFENAINMMAVQFDESGNAIGSQPIRYLIHESSLTLANKILKPNEVVNAQYKSATDFASGLGNSKFAGVYGTTGSDWIAIGANHQIYRYVMKGYLDGRIRFYEDSINETFNIEISDWSKIVCKSPAGIVKSIVG